MGRRADRAHAKITEAENQHAAGKISYDKLVKVGSKQLKKIEADCPHTNTETETINGVTVTSCLDCTKAL